MNSGTAHFDWSSPIPHRLFRLRFGFRTSEQFVQHPGEPHSRFGELLAHHWLHLIYI